LAAVAHETQTESWDTEGFRSAVEVAKAGYLLLLLIAILLIALSTISVGNGFFKLFRGQMHLNSVIGQGVCRRRR